jgi:hypothetical protein
VQTFSIKKCTTSAAGAEHSRILAKKPCETAHLGACQRRRKVYNIGIS